MIIKKGTEIKYYVLDGLNVRKNYEYLIKELSGTGIELDIVGEGSLEKELIEIS